ncbi:unnamed protein product [Mortierella alpina]
MTDLAEPVSDALHVKEPQGEKDPAKPVAACAQMKAHSPLSTSIVVDGDTRTAVATAAAKGDGEGELGVVSSCNPTSNNHKHAPAFEKHEHGCPAVSNPHPSLLPTPLAPNTPSHPPGGTEVAQAHDPASLLPTGTTANGVSVSTRLIPSTPNTKSFPEDDVVIADKGDALVESEIQGHSSPPFSSETMSSTAPQPPCVFADKPSSPNAFTHLETPHMSASAPASAHETLSFQSSTCSSSSSSLSEYLIIGQEQVESEFDDQQSERSYSSRDSFYGSGDGEGDHYHEGGETSETSQDSQSEDRASTPQRSTRRRSSQQPHHHRSAFSDGHPTDYQQDQQYQYMFIQQQLQQQRITQLAPKAADENESLDSASSSPSTRTSSPVPENTRKRRSRRVPQEESSSTQPQCETSSSSSSSSMGSGVPLPALKLPSLSASLGGLSKSIFEFVLASVVCLSLLSCMFAFSYVSSGTKHLLGWYADQHIGQRIRDGIKEREHYVQEALEKMAGEEYAKVKRRSRQQYQPQQPPYGHRANRYQQQYQQQREQRQQERDQQQQQQQQQQQKRQQQQQRQQEEYERGRLSTAEWQELIRAASMSFMAKFTASPAAASRRR